MKVFFAIISILISGACYSQTEITFKKIIVDSGKYEFREQAKKDTPDYRAAFRILTNQVKHDPTNAEYRYFLGYTLDRMNANDGSDMYKVTKNITIDASKQFEEVNRLQPRYKGEIFVLDPYSKLTSIWGSLAQAYLTRKLTDSARWAFSEGKKRGGFSEPILEFNRQLLNSCDKNAILFTTGDNITFSTWYLQTMENYRTDITVVDARLINSVWYPRYLKAERNLKLGFPDSDLDTIQYRAWKTQKVAVINPSNKSKQFIWELRPTYLKDYILRGDRIMLDIFQQNFFNRPMYFNQNSDSSYNLHLSPHFKNEGLVDRVIFNMPDKKGSEVSINLYNYNIEKIKKEDVSKSRDIEFVLNGFRWAFLANISDLVERGHTDRAKELIKILNSKFEPGKLPFISSEIEASFNEYFESINSDPD